MNITMATNTIYYANIDGLRCICSCHIHSSTSVQSTVPLSSSLKVKTTLVINYWPIFTLIQASWYSDMETCLSDKYMSVSNVPPSYLTMTDSTSLSQYTRLGPGRPDTEHSTNGWSEEVDTIASPIPVVPSVNGGR